jgi:predicted PhzF superfamily epimerase YddE/YHI9
MWLCVFESEDDVRALQPDFSSLGLVPIGKVIVTAPGNDCDFVSRFFAPAAGVPEDPVTGSAHCTLVPYWAERLGKMTFHARQVSRRGGELRCELDGQRVKIAGKGVSYLKGQITV